MSVVLVQERASAVAVTAGAELAAAQVGFRRYRFSPTGDFGYRGLRGAEGLGYRFTLQAYPYC